MTDTKTILLPEKIELPWISGPLGVIEDDLEMPLVLLLSDIDASAVATLRSFRRSLPSTPVGVLVDSPGGSADAAFRIASILTHECGGYTAIVPRYAKSAATLFCLGAEEIILSKYGELGPLDAQVFNADQGRHGPALDDVQALDQVFSFSLEAIDRMMSLLSTRTGRSSDALYPIASEFVASFVRPLLEKFDTVRYTERSRLLRVAEVYAHRLMAKKYEKKAPKVANHLVTEYPDHGFVIDPDEAKRAGIETRLPSPEMGRAFDSLDEFLRGFPPALRLVGLIERKKADATESPREGSVEEDRGSVD